LKINYPAVLVAAFVHFIIGGVWYGVIFSNMFIELMHWTPQQLEEVANRSHTVDYLAAFAAALVLSYILAHFIQYTKARSVLSGIQTAFWLWFGFVVTTQLPTVVFEQRSFGLYLLNIGYQLVGCVLGGIILAVWQPKNAS
jgi:hypothetical protein